MTDRKSIIDKIVKEALYYFDKGRIYRPNKKELGNQSFYCPRCRRPLVKTRFKMTIPIFYCKKCKFMIEQGNILDSAERIKEHTQNKVKIEEVEGDVIINQASKSIKAMQNLGYQNGWREVPQVVKHCRSLGHRTENDNEGRSLNRTTCKKCDYTYLTDSSD